MKFRISVDTGGTFTDVVVADEHGKLMVGKALTTPDRVFTGFSGALQNAAASLNTSIEEVLQKTGVLIYGTTRSTNAIVTSSAAKTVLLTTEGFPDTLTYRHGGKREPLNLKMEFPEPYIPRRLTEEIRERVNSEGGIETPLDINQASEVIESLKQKNVEAIAVSFLWSIMNPEHELQVGKLIEKILPGIPYTLSHQLNPIIREFPRTSSTAIDASLKPLMQKHFIELEEELRNAGYEGEVLIGTSSGGIKHVNDVIEKPIFTVKSGPAMAPLAGIAYAAAENLGNDVIIVDTGGTTFDVSLIRAGEIKYTRDTWLNGEWIGHNLGLSSVDIRSVGAGGGSIAWIDSGGLLRVGPDSAGADPGPACYGKGGNRPTVTDAAVLLGYIDPDHFLGGRMALNVSAAKDVIGGVATELKMNLEETAAGILEIAGEQMIKAIQEITVQDGVNPAESILVAGGGAAGLNILPIAQSLGCSKVLLPKTAGALSACGGQYSDIVSEYSASRYSATDNFDFDGVAKIFSTLNAKLDSEETSLRTRGVTNFTREFFVEARYLNQQWEMEFKIPMLKIENSQDVENLINEFHDVHFRRSAVKEDGGTIECINWKGRLIAEMKKPPHAQADIKTLESTKPDREVSAYFSDHGEAKTPVYIGSQLPAQSKIQGPAIIEEPTTTVVVYPRTSALVTSNGHYLLTPAK
jgi:N-methylhydantoinase A